MKKPPTQETPRRQPFNAYIDEGLVVTLKAYCLVNRQAGSPSDVIERELARLLKSKARKYKLNIPKHFFGPV